MTTSSCLVNVSVGELFDKYSILEIKSERIKDTEKRNNVIKELAILQIHVDNYNLDKTIFAELKQVNESLWDIEDAIREKEDKKEFDNEFIELARSVYIENDKRSHIKNNINKLLKSDIIDIKSYASYFL